MPVTREQAQMLTTLAVAARPIGAPRWDAAGVMAEIAKVKDRHLADVVLAVIRAADDRDAKTPGVISAPGSVHWRERGTDRPANRDNPPKHARCAVCSLSAERCRQVWADDHDFRPNADHKRDPEQIHRIAQGLRQAAAETVIEPVTDGPVEYRDPGTQEWKPCPPDMPTPYTAEEPA